MTTRAAAPMTRHALDNVAIVFDALDDAVARYRSLGFTVVPGGSHGGSTHVALVAFEDGTYLQLMAFEVPAPTHRWWAAKEQGGGFVGLCLVTPDVAADVAALRRVGAAMSDPVRGGRMRPDGQRVEWALASTVGAGASETAVLVEDLTPRDARVPAERAHENGATGIAHITLATDDLTRGRRWWSALLGQPPQAIVRPDVDATGVRFNAGRHGIELLTPRTGASSLAAWLSARGPSPYSIALTGPGARVFDERTAGTRLRMA